MSLKPDGPSPFRWSHSEICTWLGVDGCSGLSLSIVLARIIYEGFYSNRPTPLRQAWPRAGRGPAGRLSARSVNILFKYASLPRGSARPSRVASRRFRHEPLWIMRASIPPRLPVGFPSRKAAPSVGRLPLLVQRE